MTVTFKEVKKSEQTGLVLSLSRKCRKTDELSLSGAQIKASCEPKWYKGRPGQSLQSGEKLFSTLWNQKYAH